LYYRLSPMGFSAIPDPLVLVRQHLGERLTTTYQERRDATEKLARKWGATLKSERFLACYPPLAVLNTAQNLALRGRRLEALRMLLSPRCWEAEAGLLFRESTKVMMIVVMGRQISGKVLLWYREFKLARASRRSGRDQALVDQGGSA